MKDAGCNRSRRAFDRLDPIHPSSFRPHPSIRTRSSKAEPPALNRQGAGSSPAECNPRMKDEGRRMNRLSPSPAGDLRRSYPRVATPVAEGAREGGVGRRFAHEAPRSPHSSFILRLQVAGSGDPAWLITPRSRFDPATCYSDEGAAENRTAARNDVICFILPPSTFILQFRACRSKVEHRFETPAMAVQVRPCPLPARPLQRLGLPKPRIAFVFRTAWSPLPAPPPTPARSPAAMSTSAPAWSGAPRNPPPCSAERPLPSHSPTTRSPGNHTA